MVEHVFHRIPILLKLHVFVVEDLQVHFVIQQYKIIHVQVIRVKHVVIVHYQHQIHRIHVFVNQIILVPYAKEVR
jgi:hypothetical protein